MRRALALLLLGLAACGRDPAPSPPSPATTPGATKDQARADNEPEGERMLVLSLPDGEASAAVELLAKAGITPLDIGGGLGVTGIGVTARDYDAAARVFLANPTTARYVVSRDAPANRGASKQGR